MKILLVTFSDNSDHQDTMFGLYEQLQKKEDATLLVIKQPRVPFVKDENLWLVDCPKRPGICKKTFDVLTLAKLIFKIRKEKFDVIYFESLHLWNLPIMLCSKRKTRIYHCIHEVIPHEGDSQVKMVEIMNRALIQLTDIIVLHNKTYINDLKKKYNVQSERVKYLELWRRYPAYTEPVCSGKVLFFGRINPYKGADNLVEIAKLCPTVIFRVVGRVDSQMEGIVRELEKCENVELKTGYVSDQEMKEEFVGADWVIVPYNSASQSGVIIDAYKYSRPVIAFDVGAISEQVRNSVSGYLVKARNNKEFAKTVRDVQNMSKIKYVDMSVKAYEYGKEKYAAEGAVNRFLRIIQ